MNRSLVWAVTSIVLLGSTCRGQWIAQESGTKARLRGLSVVNAEVAWASGTGGTFVRTTDGGKTWRAMAVPGAEALDFRDVHAVNENTAYLLSIGEGDSSRIYKTTDGGANWTLQYRCPEPKGFLDALAFWDAAHGLALGDPVDGRYFVLATDDGGKNWSRIKADGLPPSLPGEGAFAASGTCLITGPDGLAWFGTGGAKAGRVFRSTDRGRTWTVHETPIRAGASSGIFSLAFRDAEHGIAVGGDYKKPDDSTDSVALTTDGGRTWSSARGPLPSGYRSAVTFLLGSSKATLVAVGPNGSDASDDSGATWRRLGTTGFHAVGFAKDGTGWAVGEDGAIARFRR
jgi:photosystem II stability/assembly factor-like uncharacterized protein